MSLRFLLVIFLLMFGGKDVSASEEECAPYFTPEIIVAPYFDEPEYDFSVNAKDLPTKQEVVPAGLMTFKHQFTGEQQIYVTTRGNGVYCAQISRFRMNINATNTKIYVAKEIPKNSCGQKVMIEHELKHVAVVREYLKNTQSALTEILEKALRQIGVVKGGSVKEVEEALDKAVMEFRKSLTTNLEEALNRVELRVDTQEEYERLAKSCGGELEGWTSKFKR